MMRERANKFQVKWNKLIKEVKECVNFLMCEDLSDALLCPWVEANEAQWIQIIVCQPECNGRWWWWSHHAWTYVRSMATQFYSRNSWITSRFWKQIPDITDNFRKVPLFKHSLCMRPVCGSATEILLWFNQGLPLSTWSRATVSTSTNRGPWGRNDHPSPSHRF
jgi:hypothetical protein